MDNDKVNNFLNESLLSELNITEEVKVVTNGQVALDYVLMHCQSSLPPLLS